MGLLLGKAMEENFKKNQEFMLASQRAQVCCNTCDCSYAFLIFIISNINKVPRSRYCVTFELVL